MKKVLKLTALVVALLGSFSIFSNNALAKDIYLLSSSAAAVYTFDSDSSGTVPAIRTISGAATTLTTNDIYGLAVYNNEIYVTDESTRSINVFQTSDDGNIAPTRQISGGNTGFVEPRNITISDGYIYCVDENDKAIKVFKTSDSGNVAPTRQITDFTDTVYACSVYNGELYVMDIESIIHVFNTNADGTMAATQTRTIDVSGSLVSPRGMFIADGIIYASDANQIDTYTAMSSNAATPSTTITDIDSNLSSVHSLLVYGGDIYAANYSNSAKAIEVFSTSANGAVNPDRFFTAAGISNILQIAMETNGYVTPSRHQQSGVTVSVTSSTQNATSEEVFQSTFSPPATFSKITPLAEFTATVDSNGANGVFSFNSTALNGTAGSYTLLKCFSTNGTSKNFGNYALTTDTDTDGTWWIEDANGNYLSADTTLTTGTNYHINFVVKDNGNYDEDRTFGQIQDPAVLGSSYSGGGCVFNPTAGFSLEWGMLCIGALLAMLRKPGNK